MNYSPDMFDEEPSEPRPDIIDLLIALWRKWTKKWQKSK